ncbi:MAG: XisI protein [Cyanobacteria bacterium J06623_7]
MDKLTKYRQIVCQFLEDFAQDDPEANLIFDLERDRFMVMHVNWRNEYRIYGCAMHLDLIDDKVWIQHNSTEIYIDRELIKLGIDAQDIVLGFRSPSIRDKLTSVLADR